VWISCSLGCCSSDYPALDLAEKDMPFSTPPASGPAARPATQQ
jgi:hypothetical protein